MNRVTTKGKMPTAQQVREISDMSVSTLHDWAAEPERGIDALGDHTSLASAAVIAAGPSGT